MPLNFTCVERSQFKGEKDTLALFAWEQERLDTDGWFDTKKESHLKTVVQREGFKGKPGDCLIYYPENSLPCSRLALVGLGKKKEADLNSLRSAAGKALKASVRQSETLWVGLPQWSERTPLENVAQAIIEGAGLAEYEYLKYKTNGETRGEERILKNVQLVAEKTSDAARANAGIARAAIAVEATNFVRDLVNEPPSFKRPIELAKIAKNLANRHIKVKVYTKPEVERLGMNAFLGVSRGSSHDPVFVHLVYRPEGTPKKRLGLVGKGITFDSGGLNIKTGNNMTTMKLDMAGGATVMAVIAACEKLNIPHEVQGFIPFTENMPGGNAYKPGDVVRALNGKTIEILNTDAEGRLVLADALSFAVKQDLDAIIDLATLTGAVLIALGDLITGLMSNNDKLAQEFETAAKKTGEKIWRLPLDKDYKERYKSKVADMANIAARAGTPGTIGAGLFLQEFVSVKPWMHLDIAGTAWADTESVLQTAGGTGAMVRTLLEFLAN